MQTFRLEWELENWNAQSRLESISYGLFSNFFLAPEWIDYVLDKSILKMDFEQTQGRGNSEFEFEVRVLSTRQGILENPSLPPRERRGPRGQASSARSTSVNTTEQGGGNKQKQTTSEGFKWGFTGSPTPGSLPSLRGVRGLPARRGRGELSGWDRKENRERDAMHASGGAKLALSARGGGGGHNMATATATAARLWVTHPSHLQSSNTTTLLLVGLLPATPSG
ncbi:hypothetical protein T439DRAFT_330884 [Meredithblackwellia eburnea MCA 4105]